MLERTDPATYTTAFPKRGREHRILIDYLRNNRTNTSIAAFSTRALKGAPVSMPIGWAELTPRLEPSAFTVLTVPKRLRRRNPWAGYWSCRQQITAGMFAAVRRAE
jgi:bifunctional non-homologous end joining protein LigD